MKRLKTDKEVRDDRKADKTQVQTVNSDEQTDNEKPYDRPKRLDFVDNLLIRILSSVDNDNSLEKTVSENDITKICTIAKQQFQAQEMLLQLDLPLKIVGDTHGQFFDVLRIFDRVGFPPRTNFLFLGDYVDRGSRNLEVILLFLCYKILYQKNFFLLRGNHETSPINRVYGFYTECQNRYSVSVWNVFQDTFNYMPICALVGDKILCMHGGLSPRLNRLEDIRNVKRPMNEPEHESLEIDLLWSDPDSSTDTWGTNTRGTSVVFGSKIVDLLTKKLKLDLIVRAHQVVQDGYEFFANKKLVTIFSAPHYCGQFDNAAAILCVKEDLSCNFHVIKAKKRRDAAKKWKAK